MFRTFWRISWANSQELLEFWDLVARHSFSPRAKDLKYFLSSELTDRANMLTKKADKEKSRLLQDIKQID